MEKSEESSMDRLRLERVKADAAEDGADGEEKDERRGRRRGEQ